MDKNQFESLENPPRRTERVTAGFLQDQTPRTLIYGYSTARDTFHLYLAEDGIHLVIYDYHKLQLQHKHENEGIRFSECVPDKRVYPEACDYEFCTMLLQADVRIPFTTWSDDRAEKPFHGYKAEELVSKYAPKDFQLPRQFFEELVESELGDLGSRVSLEQVDKLVELLLSASQSYLMASILQKDNPSNPERWLTNLPQAITLTVSGAEESVTAEHLASQLSQINQRLVAQAQAFVKPKLEELLAR